MYKDCERICEKCRYYADKYDVEPCSRCKHGIPGDDPRYETAPVLFEGWEFIKDHDAVNHPAHYETGKFECIDVMTEAIGLEDTKGFCLCNAFKYIYRCTKKHETPVEDVKKAVWYLNKFLELEGVPNTED